MRRTLMLAPLTFVVAAIALAQAPPMSPEFQVNTYTTGDQAEPTVAMDSSGRFVVVWESEGQDGSGSGIFGQRYSAVGDPLGAEFQINTYTTGDQERPSAAMDASSGRFVVVWQSKQDASNRNVFAQRFDADGAPEGPEFRVNAHTVGEHSEPDVAADDQGNFVVVWQWLDFVRARRFDSQGSPLGNEFLVSTGGSALPAVATGADGQFVVAWTTADYYGGNYVMMRPYDGAGSPICSGMPVSDADPAGPGVFMAPSGTITVAFDKSPDVMARRLHACGDLGPPFPVDDLATTTNASPRISGSASGDFIVTWSSASEGSSTGIYGRRFAAGGQPLSTEFLVNAYTTGDQASPASATNAEGRTVLAWESAGQDGSGLGIYARRLENPLGEDLAVDVRPAGSGSSNLNAILEPGETVRVEPTWLNTGDSDLELTGVASSLGGPPGLSYDIVDTTAEYGPVPPNGTAGCGEASGDCYDVAVSGARPAGHLDAKLEETLSTGDTRTWTLHIGDSFVDVPTSQAFYGDVETLFHRRVTGGCGSRVFCPSDPVRRDQMAAFLLRAAHGSLYVPPHCTGIFVDVPCPSPFANWIEQLFAQGITGGCGPSSYCPSNPVTRAQVAVFLLKAEHGAGYSPPPCEGLFPDVPCPGPFTDWIEQLVVEGISEGCGGGDYCPGEPVNRGQMAAFLVRTFALGLYGP